MCFPKHLAPQLVDPGHGGNRIFIITQLSQRNCPSIVFIQCFWMLITEKLAAQIIRAATMFDRLLVLLAGGSFVSSCFRIVAQTGVTASQIAQCINSQAIWLVPSDFYIGKINTGENP